MTCDKCGLHIEETTHENCPVYNCLCGHIVYPEPPPPPKWREYGIFQLYRQPLGKKMRVVAAIHAVGWDPERIANRFEIKLEEVKRVLLMYTQMQVAAAHKRAGLSPAEIAGHMRIPRDKIYRLLKLSAEVK